MEGHTTIKSALARPKLTSLPPPNSCLQQIKKELNKKEERTLNDVYSRKRPYDHNRYGVQAVGKASPARVLDKSSSSNSGGMRLRVWNSWAKATSQYFFQMDNIRMAERLLLAQPSRELSKHQHQRFFTQHIKYKKNLQMRRTILVSNRKKQRNCTHLKS
jgi:hypothetical protein